MLSLIGQAQSLRRTQSVEAGTSPPPIIRLAQLTSSDTGDPEIKLFNKVDNMKYLSLPFGHFGPIIIIRLSCSRYGPFTHEYSHLLKSVSDCFVLSSLQGLLLGWSFAYNEIQAIQDFLGKLPKVETMNIHEPLPVICCAISESTKDSQLKGQTKRRSRGIPCREGNRSTLFLVSPFFLPLRPS